MGCCNEHNSGGARFTGENRTWWGRAGAHGSSRMTHVCGALPSVPNQLSLFPALIDHGNCGLPRTRHARACAYRGGQVDREAIAQVEAGVDVDGMSGLFSRFSASRPHSFLSFILPSNDAAYPKLHYHAEVSILFRHLVLILLAPSAVPALFRLIVFDFRATCPCFQHYCIYGLLSCVCACESGQAPLESCT